MCSVMMGLAALQGFAQHRQIQQETKAQMMMYRQQAEAAAQNARVADRQREQVADRYAQEQMRLDARRRLVMGQNAASAGASGFDGTGSVLDMDASTIGAWREDSLNLLSNQRNDALDMYRNQVNYENEARANQAAEYNAKQQGKAMLLANFLSTAVSMYGAYKSTGGAGKGAAKGAESSSSWKPETGFESNSSNGTFRYTGYNGKTGSFGGFNAGQTGGFNVGKIGTPSLKFSYMKKDYIGQGVGRHQAWRIKG